MSAIIESNIVWTENISKVKEYIMSKKTAADALDGEFVRIIDKNHNMYGFCGEASFDPGTGFYDVLETEEDSFKLGRVVENLTVEQLKVL